MTGADPSDLPGDPTTMRMALRELAAGRDLERDTMRLVFREIMTGRCDPAQIGALLLGLAQKGETAGEIAGAAEAMREAVRTVPTRRRPLVDTCGTGGSGTARLNVSTAVALVLAACGVAVAKHGNRAISSKTGSADVLEALGVSLDAAPEAVGRSIDAVGCGFLFAPALHPAMRHAAGPRRALGIRTIFNLLGPLTNPAGVQRQLLGVYDPRRCTMLAQAAGALGHERVLVVHGFRAGDRAAPEATPCIDDVSTEGETLVVQWHEGRLDTHVVRPEMAGLKPVALAELEGGGPAQNAEALLRLLEGEPSAYRTAVQFSGAMALLVAGDGSFEELPHYAARIAQVLDDGRARSVLADLVTYSHDRADEQA